MPMFPTSPSLYTNLGSALPYGDLGPALPYTNLGPALPYTDLGPALPYSTTPGPLVAPPGYASPSMGPNYHAMLAKALAGEIDAHKVAPFGFGAG